MADENVTDVAHAADSAAAMGSTDRIDRRTAAWATNVWSEVPASDDDQVALLANRVAKDARAGRLNAPARVSNKAVLALLGRIRIGEQVSPRVQGVDSPSPAPPPAADQPLPPLPEAPPATPWVDALGHTHGSGDEYWRCGAAWARGVGDGR